MTLSLMDLTRYRKCTLKLDFVSTLRADALRVRTH